MKIITKYAKENRRNLTPSESRLKKLLSRWGIRYRSQRQFDFYIVDFLLPDRRLVIEVDGDYHNNTVTYDTKRQRYLENLGLSFIRVSNNYILSSDCEELKSQILSHKIVEIKGLAPRYTYGRARR